MVRYWARVCAAVASTALTGLLVLATPVALRLAQGPIALDEFVDQIESRLSAEMQGWRLDIGDASVALDATANSVGVHLDALELVGPEGRRAAGVAEARVRLDLGEALQGSLAVTEAEIVGARALLRRTADGRFFISMERDGVQAQAEQRDGGSAVEISAAAFSSFGTLLDEAAAANLGGPGRRTQWA